MTTTTHTTTRNRGAGIAATAGLILVAMFQAALALGAPLGEAAWGGASAELPAELRIGSAVAVLIWSFAAYMVAQRSGLIAARLGQNFVRRGTWVLVAIFVPSTLMNWMSPSALERYTWGPVTLILLGLLFVIARSPQPAAL